MARVGVPLVSPSDEEVIWTVVKEYGAAWNRHDMAALAELFTDDAHWINIVGMHWPDKSVVVTGHEAFHRTFFQTTEIELANIEIRGIALGVAAAVVLLKVGPFTPPDGARRPASDDLPSLILTNRGGVGELLRATTR